MASARFPLEDIARPSLRRLAEETGESAFFSIRRGTETVCLLREEGSFPVRSFVLHEGVRFPLGVASAGTAIIAFLPEEEQEELLATGQPRRAFRGGDTEARSGTTWQRPGSPAIRSTPAWSSKAAGVWARRSSTSVGRPAWALSLTGIEPRFREDRQEFLGRLLLEEAHRLTVQLRHGLGPPAALTAVPGTAPGPDPSTPANCCGARITVPRLAVRLAAETWTPPKEPAP